MYMLQVWAKTYSKTSNTSRGSKSDVLIEARSPIKAGSLIQAGAEVTCSNRSRGLLLEVLRVSTFIIAITLSIANRLS